MYLEEFSQGASYTSPGVTVTEAQIIDFALQFDPQPFHLDKEAAARSHFGGLIASGYHVLALSFRLLLMTGVICAENSLGSWGIDEVRWLAPLRPGDTLTLVAEVRGIQPSTSRHDRGTVRLTCRAQNQHVDTVMTFTANQLIRRIPRHVIPECNSCTG